MNACIYNNYVLNRAEQGKKHVLLQSMAMTSIVGKKKLLENIAKCLLPWKRRLNSWMWWGKEKWAAGTEEFKIGKMHATNIIKHESQGNFQGKGFKHIQRQNPQKYKVLNDFLYS